MVDQYFNRRIGLQLVCRMALLAAVIAAVSGQCLAQTAPTELPMPPTMENVPINAPIPPITIDAGDEQINGASGLTSNTGDFTITGGVTVTGGSEFTLRADTITGSMKTGIATAVGHVSFRELNSYLYVDSLFASEPLKSGIAQNVQIYSAPYSITAQHLTFENDEVDLDSAVLTTCPPGEKPEYSIRARRIEYQPLKHRIVIRNGALFLGSTRLFEDRKFVVHLATSRTGQTTATSALGTSFGFNGYSGPFVVYTTHSGVPGNGTTASLTLPALHGISVLLTASTPLITPKSNSAASAPKSLIGRIRQAVESTEPLLPPGDPLLFHWFQTTTVMSDLFYSIPSSLAVSATGTASYRERVYGHETNDLYYSRQPEAALTATAPLSGPRTLPTTRDPSQMRSALRQIALYAVLTPTIGRYAEYPDNITTNRAAVEFSIQARPILIGKNLLFKPLVNYQDSTYPEVHQAFHILQYDAAIEKYFTDRCGFGLEYSRSIEEGSSPFQFDTPYASEELDGRLQWELRKVILGAVLRYDLQDQNLYSEQIMVAPVLRSLIPRFTYDFRDGDFGVGVDIQGLTY